MAAKLSLRNLQDVVLGILDKPLLLVLLWALWISAQYWIFGAWSYMRIHDNGESQFAYRAMTAQIYAGNGFSVWLPNVAAGIDSFITENINYFTYDFAAFFLLPDWLAYGVIMFLQRFLAAYFTYRLCRDFLRFETYAAILAGIFWSLGTWATNDWTLYDGLGTPLIPAYLYWLEKSLNQPGWKKYAWASLTGLLVSYLSFFPLFTPFFVAGAFLWLWIVRSYDIKTLVPLFLVFGLFSFTFDIPQLSAILLNAALSGRIITMSLASMPIGDALPTLLEGIGKYFLTYRVMWAMMLGGLLFTRFRDKGLLRLTLTALGVVLGSRLLWFVSVTNREALSLLSIVNFNDFILIATFIPSVAAAGAVDRIGKAEARLTLSRPVQDSQQTLFSVNAYGLVLLLCAGLTILVSAGIKLDHFKRIRSDNYVVNFKNPDLLRLADESHNELFRVAVVGVSNASAFSASGDNFYPNYAGVYGFEAVDGYLGMYSKRYEDYWGEVIEPLRLTDPGIDVRWKTKPIWIYLFAPVDGSFDRMASIDFDKYYNLHLLSLANTKYLISRWPLEDENLILKSEPVNIQADRADWHLRSRLGKIVGLLKGDLTHRALYVYENVYVLPRVFLVPQARLFETSDALLDTLEDMPIAEIQKTVFIESADASMVGDRPLGFSRSEVEILNYTPDRIVVSVKSDGPAILVMTNNYSPFWKIWVGGMQQTIFPAYHTFQGVYLEAGQHEVVFEYDPPYKLLWVQMMR